MEHLKDNETSHLELQDLGGIDQTLYGLFESIGYIQDDPSSFWKPDGAFSGFDMHETNIDPVLLQQDTSAQQDLQDVGEAPHYSRITSLTSTGNGNGAQDLPSFGSSLQMDHSLADIFALTPNEVESNPLGWLGNDSPNLSETSMILRPAGDESGVSGASGASSTEQQNNSIARGLPRRRSQYSIKRPGLGTRPIAIPIANHDPMERWQESPPEDEPAHMSDIIKAIRRQSTDKASCSSETPSISSQRRRSPTSATSSVSGTSVSSLQSTNSTQSAISSTAHDPVLSQSRRSANRIGKSRRSKINKINPSEKSRIFCCTFCCDRFKSKYDWVRHEKSLHLSLEGWVCTPFGGSVASTVTEKNHCTYCNALEPTAAHLEGHNYGLCSDKSRSFRRKDHLVQHLRLAHRLQKMPSIDDWKISTKPITSRCGFCDHRLANWEERTEHLAKHFRSGSTMSDWHGDHGLSPSVTAKVTNSLPPYLIGMESQTLVPFSATSSNSRDHMIQVSTRLDSRNQTDTDQNKKFSDSSGHLSSANESSLGAFAELLSLHLSRYARVQLGQGVLPTDAMFQQEARKVLYECEDSWNQSIADNPTWLANFRKQHGLTSEDVPPVEKKLVGTPSMTPPF